MLLKLALHFENARRASPSTFLITTIQTSADKALHRKAIPVTSKNKYKYIMHF